MAEHEQIHSKQKIAVLTYNQTHRKTYDTLSLLKANGYHDVIVYAQPMTYTKKYFPYVTHRPDQIMSIPKPKELCKNLGYDYQEGVFREIAKDENRIYLLCGAGLLEKEFVQNRTIINAHPGFIPFARGLDSYKWSIYKNLPLGVTTHFLGEYVDAGEIIERRKIQVKEYDTFHSVAQKIYETEVDMLVGAIEHIEEKHEIVIPDTDEIFRRMPHEIEKNLLAAFEHYKAKHLKS